MRTMGIIATILASGVVVLLAATLVVSLPDINRYRRVKNM